LSVLAAQLSVTFFLVRDPVRFDGAVGASRSGVGEGVGVGVGEGVGVGVGFGLGVGVGDGLGVGVGVGVGPPKLMRTVAPVAETASVVIDTPLNGSCTVDPTGNAASEKEVVVGVVSTSCDCVRVV
jgi:hypothetical protein